MVWDTLVIPYRSRDRGEAWHGIHVTRLREVELGHLGALQGTTQALQTDPGSRFDTQAVMVLALAQHDEVNRQSAKQAELVHKPMRKVMPIERMEIGRKFQVGEYEGYIHVGLYEDGSPGDIFIGCPSPLIFSK